MVITDVFDKFCNGDIEVMRSYLKICSKRDIIIMSFMLDVYMGDGKGFDIILYLLDQ